MFGTLCAVSITPVFIPRSETIARRRARSGTLLAWDLASFSQKSRSPMLRGIYQAGAGLQAASTNQELTAENLANATTTGYRRQGMTFASLLGGAGTPASGVAGNAAGPYTNFAPGSSEQTGSPLDVALQGDGFFVL